MGWMLCVTVFGCVSHHVVTAIYKVERRPTLTMSLRARSGAVIQSESHLARIRIIVSP